MARPVLGLEIGGGEVLGLGHYNNNVNIERIVKGNKEYWLFCVIETIKVVFTSLTVGGRANKIVSMLGNT